MKEVRGTWVQEIQWSSFVTCCIFLKHKNKSRCSSSFIKNLHKRPWSFSFSSFSLYYPDSFLHKLDVSPVRPNSDEDYEWHMYICSINWKIEEIKGVNVLLLLTNPVTKNLKRWLRGNSRLFSFVHGYTLLLWRSSDGIHFLQKNYKCFLKKHVTNNIVTDCHF